MSQLIIKPFLFKDELDILEIQLEELCDVVDYFVIVEGELSFQGRAREQYPVYEKNLTRFDKYKSKIIYCKLDADTYPADYANISSQQRRDFSYSKIKEVVERMKFPVDTIVLFGDCDEIPRKQAIEAIKNKEIEVVDDVIIVLQMNLYYFYFNYMCNTVRWNGFKVLTLNTFMRREIYNQVRCLHDYTQLPTVLECGWHYSYFGDVDFVLNKLDTTCDGTQLRENASIYNKANIQEAMVTGRDLYRRADHHWEILSLDNLDVPQGVGANPQKYRQYFNIK